ncbi:MAG TPA: hypothetical protein VFW34_07150 [Candidatus Rubrimentiphilum sp.]|nr:hypothetical protein [Candidatus Rubrimentiphilum sp.]
MVLKRMQLLGQIAAITRYPVKSLAGEELQSAEIGQDGIPGDREAAFFVTAGHARTGKTYRGKEHNLLHLTGDPERAQTLARERRVDVELRRGSRYFDDAPVSLIFDRWVEEVSAGLSRPMDFRRWRPTLFAHAAGDFRFAENDLTASAIEVGTAVLRVRYPIERCVTTTYDPVTGEPDPEVLRYVARERANLLGVYCDVELAGVVRAGDALRLRAR